MRSNSEKRTDENACCGGKAGVQNTEHTFFNYENVRTLQFLGNKIGTENFRTISWDGSNCVYGNFD